MKYEDLEKVNKKLQTVDIKGKAYVQVNTRILAFRELFPMGQILTDILSIENGICTIKATITDGNGHILGTGHAYEKETSSFINKTSYIENCETSAVGRALAMLGIGVDGSMCSAEELVNAVTNQNKADDESKMEAKADEIGKKKISKVKIDSLRARCEEDGISIEKLCSLYSNNKKMIEKLEDLTEAQLSNINQHWEDIKARCS